MNIAVNAMPSSGYGGVTYLRNILPALDRINGGHQWFVYGQPATLEKVKFRAGKITFREVCVKGGIAGRLMHEHFRLPALFRSDGIDLVYTANNTDLFFARRPRVTAIRYTEPFLYREFHNSFRKQLRCELLRILTKISLRTADHVICVSVYARRIALGGRRASLTKTSVIHHGLGDQFSPPLPRPEWAPGEYLFTAAKMIGYSNLLNLVEAYRRCRDRGLRAPLLVAGGGHDPSYEGRLKDRIRQLDLIDNVRFLGYVDPAGMAAGMANAHVFVFSSLLEACPNTLLEAMDCGAAIVASSTEPNREVAGQAVAWCDGRNVSAMADAIERVARDEAYRGELRKRALAQASRYSWETTARRLVETLEKTYRDYQSARQSVEPVRAAAHAGRLNRPIDTR